jgi:hypothetical protein
MTAGTGQEEHDPSQLELHLEPAGARHDEHEPSFRERLLNFSTMDVRFRTLTAIIVAQVVATSLLVLLSDYSFGDITINITGVGQASIGVTHYIASVAFLLIGFTLFIAGLGRADPRGATALLAFFFALYLVNLILTWGPLDASITIFVTIILMFVACMMAAIFIRRTMVAKSPQAAPGNPAVWLLLLLVPWTAVGLYFIVSHPAFFYTMQFAIGTPFIALYPFAAIDWAEIADSFAKNVQRHLHLQQRNGGLIIFSAIAAMLPIWLTAYAFTQDAQAYGYRLIVLCLLAAVLALLLRLARFRGDWPAHFPWAPTALLVVVLVILFTGGARYFDWSLIALVVAVAMGVALCVSGRNPQWQGLAPTALLGTLIGFAATYFSLFSPSGPDVANFMVLGTVVATLYAAIAVLITVGWSRIRSEGVAALRYPIQTVLTLNVSLVAVYLLAIVYDLILGSLERHVVEALVVAVVLLSELLLSGYSVTNIQTDWFPRNSRLLMFFGCVTFTLAYTLSIAALHGESAQLQAYKLFLNPENAVLSGLLLMGPAMLWALFILRTGRWLASERSGLRASALPTSQPAIQQVDTTLRKLQSILRDNVNTSYGYRGELAKFLVNAGAPN